MVPCGMKTLYVNVAISCLLNKYTNNKYTNLKDTAGQSAKAEVELYLGVDFKFVY